MTRTAASRFAWLVWVVVIATLGVNLTLQILNRSFSRGEDFFFLAISILMAFGYATVGALIASRHQRNAIGWLFLVVALGLMAAMLSEEYPIYALRTAPGSLPGAAWVAWLGLWALPLGMASVLLVIVLFPDGRPPSPRWRSLVWIIGGAAIVASAGLVLDPREISPSPGIAVDNPTGIEELRGIAGIVIAVGGWPLALSALGAVGALAMRFRSAGAEQRQQIKWLVYVVLAGGLLFVGTIVSGLTLGESGASWINDVFFTLTALAMAVGIPTASGIAILRYRLLDIDVVINKTVVYGALAAFVTLVYVGIVVGIGALVGSRGNVFLTILATAIIAIAFQPARTRARHLANRLVYGRRATPYEVLSRLAHGIGSQYSADEAAPALARIVGEGTGAAVAEVWLLVAGELRPAASWPKPAEPLPRTPIDVDGRELAPIPGIDRAVPVEHHGELLGALAVSMPRGEALTGTTEKLIEDAASQAGLMLRNVRLIEELRASRQRLVAAQDEERRRLERNIHDGAQQQLVALAVKLRLVEAMAEKDPVKAKGLAAEAKVESQEALENLRDLARGIYPPLLADKGLTAALEAQVRKAPFPVQIEPNGIGRYSAEAEATAYFCVLESLQNAAKYAQASSAMVRLAQADGHLVFSVTDDGRGFDPATTPRGTGLKNLADRVESLGGTVEIRSRPGQGTTVTGRIPVVSA
jgi:signal transduction histidine kinase